mmetsp:Transcript_91080/g.253587  ORF Transcript_91080/g.253587 Transcript_91080/m.253587 type:complete len:220 (+) Transcript_91080:599-1258(+)
MQAREGQVLQGSGAAAGPALQEDVSRLDVPVEDPPAMQVCKPGSHLREHRPKLLGPEWPGLLSAPSYHGVKRSITELDAKHVGVLHARQWRRWFTGAAYPDEAHERGVLQLAQELCFPGKVFDHVREGGLRERQDLRRASYWRTTTLQGHSLATHHRGAARAMAQDRTVVQFEGEGWQLHFRQIFDASRRCHCRVRVARCWWAAPRRGSLLLLRLGRRA